MNHLVANTFKAALLLVVLAAPVPAQQVKPASEDSTGVHRMEIFNGGSKTVRYFGSRDLSSGDEGILNDLARAENELSYLDDLQTVKSLYLASERILEPTRRAAQQQLYGTSYTISSYSSVGVSAPSYGWSYPYNAYYNPSYSATAGDAMSVTRSVAEGVGREGATKEALVSVLARQATAEYASSVQRGHDRLLVRAYGSPQLRAALGRSGSPIRAAATGSDEGVTLTLKGGDTIQGTKMTEEGDWYVVDKANGRTVRVRKTEVTRMETPRKTAVKPAS